jgi:hypothetical protein
MLLNDIDEELTKRNLDTHIVFIAYLDTMWGPLMETIKNEKRFTMVYAPITRSYSETYEVDADDNVNEFKLNHLTVGKGMPINLGYLNFWKKTWKGDCFTFEYHFWRVPYLDLGSMHNAKIIYGDIKGLKKCGLAGVLEDGSQRSYFPTGFPFYVHGEALFDESKTYEDLKKEYFEAAFGEHWETAVEYLDAVTEASNFQYAKGEMKPLEGYESPYYQPQVAKQFEDTIKIAEKYEKFFEETRWQHFERAQYVSWDLLWWHTTYVKGASKMLAACCVGDSDKAKEYLDELSETMKPLVQIHPTAYDHFLNINILSYIPQMLVVAKEITQ